VKHDRILLVDDEVNVLASLRRQLHKQSYEVLDAQSGINGLDIIKEKGPFAVIMSDYRMPGMDGVEFLARSQELCPDASRIMLTGSNETDVAINAVNRGNIFRFLMKPISPEDLTSAINAGVEQHRLITAERELLAELSTMQQIDRELNTYLDIGRAMDITLNWAIRKSDATAGLIGRVGEKSVQIMASQGYTDELNPFQVSLPLEPFPVFQSAITNGNPLQVAIIAGGGLLKSVQTQAIVPIRRENTTIGMLLLENESTRLFPEETMHFLARLCDHASIAISNAELYAAAQAANKAKSEFVSFVSHELKNPITSIGGFAELLSGGLAGPINDTQKEMLTSIRTGVKRMVTLVSDLSDISRIESGHLQLNILPVKLKEVVEEVAETLQPNLDGKSQALQIKIPEHLPSVLTDRNRLVQVITNLVSNANKYTQDGGEFILGAEVCANQWDSQDTSDVMHIWLKDNGIGISDEDQKKIFQKFFRSSDIYATESPGTGLGLNITKKLVEMQGGHIWFESVLRQGTTFHFTVPIVK
jgi:signal transduction histidine kinase